MFVTQLISLSYTAIIILHAVEVYRYEVLWENRVMWQYDKSFFDTLTMHSLLRYGGLETKQESLYYVFVRVYVNLCTVTVIELIVFSYN
jgi:hypothetical protein